MLYSPSFGERGGTSGNAAHPAAPDVKAKGESVRRSRLESLNTSRGIGPRQHGPFASEGANTRRCVSNWTQVTAMSNYVSTLDRLKEKRQSSPDPTKRPNGTAALSPRFSRPVIRSNTRTFGRGCPLGTTRRRCLKRATDSTLCIPESYGPGHLELHVLAWVHAVSTRVLRRMARRHPAYAAIWTRNRS
jgi:hypothetical protein